MRVEIVSEIANLKDRLLSGGSEPAAKISESHPLAKLRTLLNGKDSFLRLQDSVAGFVGRSGETHGAHAGQLMLTFRRLDLSSDQNLYFILLQTLQEVLKKASSSDALFVTMCVAAPATERAREPYLILQLEAIGVTPEQAEIRWGSGMVHVQEALLSASQLLRKHLAKTVV
jgi:hypothetical protein